MNEHLKKILIFSGAALGVLFLLKGTSFSVKELPLWLIIIAGILCIILIVVIATLIIAGFRSFKSEKKGHGSGHSDDDDDHSGGNHGGGDDHHHKVESKRAFIAKMVLLVLSFATLLAIAIIFIQAYKEVSLDKDDDKIAKQTAEQVMMTMSNRVTFRIPAGNKGKTIQFKESYGFKYDQSYIYNPDDAYKVTIVTATGRSWDDGPDMPRGEAIGPKDWPVTIISRQGEIPVFPFERAGKYNK